MARGDLRAVGILGGTFNPPHLGHLALARDAREELQLQRVAMMPAQVAPHKQHEPATGDPGGEHRLQMCRLLAQQAHGVCACALELQRPGPSYTVDTLEQLHASFPEVTWTFIVGADTARTLPDWRDPARLLALAQIAVAARAGTSRQQVRQAIDGAGRPSRAGGPAPQAEPASPTATFLDMTEVDISSSQVRRRAASGEPLEDLVGPAVAAYIAAHRLYRSHPGTDA